MATVNRFTNIEPAKYNPRSLQELMMVPAYKRQQHTATEEQLAAAETALAQVDPLAIHSDLAKMEQQKLYDQITAQSEQLANKGFTSTSKSDVIRLNKEYQQAISPTGKLGQINAAKIAAEKEKANILANAVQMGHDPAMSQQNIDKAYAEYEQRFRDTNSIENFKGVLPPKYEDLMKDVKDLKSMAGTTVTTTKGKQGYSIKPDPTTGMLVAVTTSGEILTETNAPQIAEAVKVLNNKWLEKGGAGYKSAEWNKIDPETLKRDILSYQGIITTDKTQDTRSQSYQFMKDPNAQTDENGKIRDFVSDKIQGISTNSLSQDSPLRKLDYVSNITYDANGNISVDKNTNRYGSYEEKVNSYKKDFPGQVEYDKKRGIATYRHIGKNGFISAPIDIPLESHSIKQEFEKLRKENPFVSGLSDKELVQVLQQQKESLTSNYVETIDLIGSNYDWANTRLFGREDGSNIKTSLLHTKGATINGEELPSDELYERLGYDNATEFKTLGKPSITGYSPAMGKYTATVTNSSNEPVNIFIDGEQQLKSLTPRTQAVNKALLDGKSMENLGEHSNPKYKDYNVYFINNFTDDPYIVISKNKNASNISDLLDNPQDRKYMSGSGRPNLKGKGDVIVPFSVFAAGEKNNLLMSDYFATMTGVKDTKEKN